MSTSSSPLRFAFGVHNHQPVGNFDHIIQEHVERVYHPFLSRLAESGVLPISMHISGPVLDWLETHPNDHLDLVGRLAAEGRIELLLSGLYEPVLVSLPREDRVEQIRWMRERLEKLFGVHPTGLWLTERVWEPELAADLAEAGVRYALVDDRHFAVSGFRREELHRPYWTESGGARMGLLPIDQKLRYLVPFRPPGELAEYLRGLREAGHRLAVLVDDGEKFGGWPKTRKWVYESGWLERFFETLHALVDEGEIELVTTTTAVEEGESGGIAYLPTASYQEMEKWALPTEAAIRLTSLEEELGEERLAGPEGAFVRGGHWRNFLAKYPEANRMHKKMLALSALCRARGDPPEARRAIGRAQCNDAYWHGVFGGLYLPHLRHAIWRELAIAEAELRRGEALAVERWDLDCDGHDELWIHSSEFSAIVSPHRGGAIEEYTLFGSALNYADTLTRRPEAYHAVESAGAAGSVGDAESADPPTGRAPGATTNGMPSIHELARVSRAGAGAAETIGFDRETRALFVERIVAGDLTRASYQRGEYEPLATWAAAPLEARIEATGSGGRVEVRLSGPDSRGVAELEKRLGFGPGGALEVTYRWTAAGSPPGSVFTVELSLAEEIPLLTGPEAEEWHAPIETLGRSERGLERVRQGTSVTLRWPIELGEVQVQLEIP